MGLLGLNNGKYRYNVIILLAVIWTIIYFQRVNVSVLIVDQNFLSEMGLVGQAAKQGLLMTIFLLAYSLTNVIGSPLGDRIGPVKTMIIGLFLACLAMFWGGFAGTITSLLAMRIMLGIGQGIYFPSQSNIVKKWFPPAERGTANAIYGLGGCIAPMLAIPLLTYLIGSFGWRSSFFIPAVLGLIMAYPFLKGLITDEPQENRFVKQDEADYIAQAVTRETAPITGEAKGVSYILTSGRFWLLTVAYSGYLSIWWGVMTWLPQYLVAVRGYSMQNMSFLAMLPYIFGIAGLFLGGYFSDRMNRRAEVAFFSLFGSALFIVFATYTPSNFTAVIFMAITVGLSEIHYPPIWALLQDHLPPELIGTGSGLMNGTGNLVSALSPVIIGSLIQLTGSYSAGLMYLVAIGMVGAVSCLCLARQDRRCRENSMMQS